jgi:hypothetical protein
MAGGKECVMKLPPWGRARWVALIVVVVLGLAAGGIAYASIPDSNGVINGCYQKGSGQLRVIDTGAGGACTPSENALAWNQFSGYEVVSTDFDENGGPPFTSFIEGQQCPSGKKPLSGGVNARFLDSAGNHPVQLDSSWPAGDSWFVALSRSDGGVLVAGDRVRGTVYAVCAKAS